METALAGMAWSGDFVFGETGAAYRGPSAENSPHAHAALQIAFGCVGDVTVTLDPPHSITRRAHVIRPGVTHMIAGDGDVGLIYIEPQAPLAFAILDRIGAEDVEDLPEEVLTALDPAGTPAGWLTALTASLPTPSRQLDPRVKEVLGWLARYPVPNAIALSAKRCGLSESHLRALARRELGLPLSTWLVWRKLECASRKLAEGASLADAALAGGFSDQAHCARTMRRMFGVTPRMARTALA